MTAMAAQDADFIIVKIKVYWPEWIKELSAEELENVLDSDRKRMIEAFNVELKKAEDYCRARKKAELDGQMDIYDYV